MCLCHAFPATQGYAADSAGKVLAGAIVSRKDYSNIMQCNMHFR